MLEIMPLKTLKIAKSLGLDLVEVLLQQILPICRILNLENISTSLVNKRNRKRLQRVKSKVSPRIEEHDYITKLRRSESFTPGNKLKITLMFGERNGTY